MIVEKHGHKDRIVLGLNENEFLLIAHLVEKSVIKNKKKESETDGDKLDKRMHDKIQKFLSSEF